MLRDRQVAFVARELARAADAGHVLQLEARDSRRKAGGRSYLATCSCGWTTGNPVSQTEAAVRLVAHVGLVLGDLDAARDEARRVGLEIPASA